MMKNQYPSEIIRIINSFAIFGRDDVVSKDNSDTVEYCNILSRVFFRVKNPQLGNGAKYTSVVCIEPNEKPHLYFSFQGKADDSSNPAGLNTDQVKSLFKALMAYISNPFTIGQIDKVEPALVIEMYQCRNNIVSQALVKIDSSYLGKSRKLNKEHHLHFAKLIGCISETEQLDDASISFLLENEWFKTKCNTILKTIFGEYNRFDGSSASSIRSFLSKITQNDLLHIVEEGGNVHVEAKGVYKAWVGNDVAKTFYVGLAHADSQAIGCCACCSSEFDAIEASCGGVKIYRSADKPYNFPKGAYFLSKNITEYPNVRGCFSDLMAQKFDYVLSNTSCADNDKKDLQQKITEFGDILKGVDYVNDETPVECAGAHEVPSCDMFQTG